MCFSSEQPGILIINLMNFLLSIIFYLSDEKPFSPLANPSPSESFDMTSCVAFGTSLHLSFLIYKMAINPCVVSPTQIAKAYA